MSLDGIKRTCKRYKKARTPRGVELRCAEYRKGPGTPPASGRAIAAAGIKTRGARGARSHVCRHPAGPVHRVDCYEG